MKKYPVITISREYGSGGHEIGEILAKKLGLPFYDNELITMASKDSGFSEKAFQEAENVATNSLAFSFKIAGSGEFGVPLNNQLFVVQHGIIRSIADNGPAVIVGRCADYVLSDYKPTINIFVQADMSSRINRLIERHPGITKAEAEDMAKKRDKYRATYYNYYSDRKWGSRLNYDLVINSGLIGVEAAAEFLANYINAAVKD